MSPDGSSPKPPPEEKLLRLIRGKDSGTAAAPAAPQAGSAASIGTTSGGFSHASPFRWSYFAIIGLGGILVVEAGWLMAEAIRPLPAVTMPSTAAMPSAETSRSTVEPEIPSLTASASRQLFGSAAGSSMTPSTRASQTTVGKQLASRLTLIGIMAGDPPQAIIEDSEAKKNYFVSVGQMVADGAVLEQVLDNRVILEYG